LQCLETLPDRHRAVVDQVDTDIRVEQIPHGVGPRSLLDLRLRTLYPRARLELIEAVEQHVPCMSSRQQNNGPTDALDQHFIAFEAIGLR